MLTALTHAAEAFLRERTGEESRVSWQFPREAERGDLATSLPLSLAKKLQSNPMDIAAEFARILGAVEGVERAEALAPGYVNIWLTPRSLLEQLKTSEEATKPAKVRKKEAPVIVEYSQPNIAKPLGIHHILSTVIGQSIANVYRHLGFNTVSVNHIGDWGTQFGKLAVAVQRWGTKPIKDCTIDDLLGLYVKFHDEAEKDPSLEEAGREAFRKIEQGDKDLREFWKDVVDITMKSMNALYMRLHVEIEHAHGEAMYEKMMAPILEEGIRKGVFKPGEKGAVIVEFPEEMHLSTAVVQKADAATIYMTRDFAQIRYRIDRWHPQAMYYVVDVAQSLHFKQLFATVNLLGWELPHVEHIVFGRMRFADKSMSTRKGNILKLEDVLDEGVRRATAIIAERGETIQTDDPQALAEMMGVGALVYGILSQNRKMDIVFDWDKMLSFEGNSAPYLQYTHARARSVLRKANVKKTSAPKGEVLLAPGDRLLVRTILQYPLVLEDARDTHLPHKLTNYLYQLAQDFNAFYNAQPILKAEEPQRSLRLHFTTLTADVLRSGAELLTLRVPDRM